MLPIKSESIEDPQEIKSSGIKLLPDIKSETFEYPPDVKLENIEYTPEVSPTKRLKTLTSASPSPSSKGKSKVKKEEDDDSLWEQQLDTCGVCLLQEGMSRRGFIDSCEHYFCFVCIMEWAKVESRCPICKRRFSTIRRPQDGVFFSERIVNVPVRDQVYYHNGNSTLGPSDPYSQVKCTICSLSSDDHLLLLCDLCDSAAHSYCVGLGATVPEGDWFCQDCTFSRNEHAKIETETETDPTFDNKPTLSSTSNKFHFTQSNVSIHDIVRESFIREPDSSSMAPSFGQTESVSPVDRSLNASNARTLKRCVNVHARIKVLRENWDGFRGGSLNFSSSFGKESQQESTSNVDRAWKMMDMAAKALGKKTHLGKDSKPHLKKERLLIDASKVRPKNTYLQGLKKHENGDASRNQNHVPFSRKVIASTHVKNCESNGQNVTRKYFLGVTSNVGTSDRLLIGKDKRCAKKEVDIGFKEKGRIKKEIQVDSNIKKVEDAKSEIQSLVKLNLKLLCREKKLEVDAVTSNVGSSDISIGKDKKEIDIGFNEKGRIKKEVQLGSNIKKVEDAKSEILTLVKLNLKLLSRDKKLEVDIFKEVARHATHSIMAACGIEHPKARFRSFERLVCEHNETRKRPTSTLMPTCCRECFFNFVKDVVTAIAFDKSTSFRT